MKQLDQQLDWSLGPAKKVFSYSPCCEMAVGARRINLPMQTNSIQHNYVPHLACHSSSWLQSGKVINHLSICHLD